MKKLFKSADISPDTHADGGGLAKRTFTNCTTALTLNPKPLTTKKR